MRIKSSRKFLCISGLSVCAIFLWTFLSGPHAPELQMETFSNRKSLSYENVQVPAQKVPGKNQWLASPTLVWEKISYTVARENDNTKTKMLATSKGDNLVYERNLIAQTNSRKRRGQTRLILMSYIRAGTTFTGDLFQFSPDVMYFYEPLLYTNDIDDLPKGTQVRNRLIGNFMNHPHPPETLTLLESLHGCKLTTANMEFVLGISYSHSFNEYMKCTNYPLKNNIAKCIADLTKRCQDAHNVVSKVLRLKMWEVEELLSRDPELRVIHLVRDPRGIMLSRRVASYYLQIDTLCSRMTSDAELSLKLQTTYPGRILTVRYEDLAMHPNAIAEQLYNFTGVDWTDAIAKRVQNITSPRDMQFNEKIFGTKRKNSTATALKWRLKLDFASALNAQMLCSNMMKIYGYKQLETEAEMRDLRLPSMYENYDDTFLKAVAS